MNADLNMVASQNNYDRKGSVQKVAQVIANISGLQQNYVKDKQQTMELQTSAQDMHLPVSKEPMLILNPSPTQLQPSQVAQIADQFQESFANYNWMSPRIIENAQPILSQVQVTVPSVANSQNEIDQAIL